MGVQTFGFRPAGPLENRIEGGYSRAGAAAAMSDCHPSTFSLCEELDALFARGASESEIAAFRARAEMIESEHGRD